MDPGRRKRKQCPRRPPRMRGYFFRFADMRTNWKTIWVSSTLRRAFGAVLILVLAASAGPVFSDTITLLPEGNGASTQWSVSGAGSNWEAVVANDGDSSYVFTSTRYDTDRYTMEDLPGPGTVSEVRANFYARRAGNPPAGNLSHGIVAGGSDYTTASSLGTGYALYQNAWALNPATGAAWTVEEVNGLQAVIVHDQQQAREHRVTQVYLEVEFVPAVPTPTPSPPTTATPTAVPTASPSPTPEGYMTPVPTPSPVPTATPPPASPTPTTVPAPTPTPAPLTPTVNGLFYGNGDNLRYPSRPYAYSVGESRLYATVINNTLYVALVLNRHVNDNVVSPTRAYTQSAGWGPPRPANRLFDSEFAEFSLTLGEGANEQTWTWQQGYAGVSEGPVSNTNENWISGVTVAGGGGDPPPGLVSASSFAWNLNNYAYRVNNSIDPGWDMGPAESAGQWTSPITNPSDPTNVINAAEGHPGPFGNPPMDADPITYSSTYQWEWSMVYEWSVDLSLFGEVPVFVLTGDSHHSPIKNEVYPPDPQNDPFLELNEEEPEPFFDFGDLPGPYPTLRDDNGARHVIDPSGAYLGTQVDSEPDGQPHPLALGDDLSGVDDEDGVALLVPLVAGSEAVFRITVGRPGYLSAFIDWFDTGALDDEAVTVVSASGPAPVAAGLLLDTHFSVAGVYEVTVAVPEAASGMMASRFRITTEAGEGGAVPAGRAESGEVEDYIWLSSVGNRVWSDANRNGLQDEGESGVPGVTVNLLDAQGQPVLDLEGNPMTTVTDDEGYYLFTGVIPGEYIMEFELPENYYGFTEQDVNGEGICGEENSTADPITGRSPVFTLWPGNSNPCLDAGLVEFAPTSVTLADFFAAGYAGSVAVEWRTGAETDNLGFLVHRADGAGGPYRRVSGFILVPGSNPAGGRYLFIDRAVEDGRLYFYRLEAVDTGGQSEWYGPVEARSGENEEEFTCDPTGYNRVAESEGPVPNTTPTPVPDHSPFPIPHPSTSSGQVSPLPTPHSPLPIPHQLDYDGDGTSEIAVYRPGTGLWAVRGLTRFYFGRPADLPIPGDYFGDGTAAAAIFRPGTGLWAVRELTRFYFGAPGDLPVPADYTGDGRPDPAVFRSGTGLWAVRGLSRVYFGREGDRPLPGDYYGDGTAEIAVFRPGTGLWSVRGLTRRYFGNSGDIPVPGDYSGDGTDRIAIFRPGTGLWAVQGLSRFYFGGSGDLPVPLDDDGDWRLDPAVFRPGTGLWAVRELTRVYFGSTSDLPASR